MLNLNTVAVCPQHYVNITVGRRHGDSSFLHMADLPVKRPVDAQNPLRQITVWLIQTILYHHPVSRSSTHGKPSYPAVNTPVQCGSFHTCWTADALE